MNEGVEGSLKALLGHSVGNLLYDVHVTPFPHLKNN